MVGSLSAGKEALVREARQPSNLKGLARKAVGEGLAVFYSPAEGVYIDSPATLYYNSASSPLPGHFFSFARAPPPSFVGSLASSDRCS